MIGRTVEQKELLRALESVHWEYPEWAQTCIRGAERIRMGAARR